jgi:hypothetical protein
MAYPSYTLRKLWSILIPSKWRIGALVRAAVTFPSKMMGLYGKTRNNRKNLLGIAATASSIRVGDQALTLVPTFKAKIRIATNRIFSRISY